MDNREILENLGVLSKSSIGNVMRITELLEIGQIVNVNAFPGKYGYTLQISNIEQKEFYFGLSELGFVEIVRADSPTGEILYMPHDDWEWPNGIGVGDVIEAIISSNDERLPKYDPEIMLN